MSNAIEKTNGYKIGTLFFASFKEAQKAALCGIVKEPPGSAIVDQLIANAELVKTILTTPKEGRSRQTRKDKGIKRGSRKPAVNETATVEKTE